MDRTKTDILFESSWEVCNRVGGIYTVVKSKVVPMMDAYKGKRYIMVGPFFPDKHYHEFVEDNPSEGMREVFDRLLAEGISCHYGRWMVAGKPETILVCFKDYFYKKNEIKGKLFEDYGIDSLNSQHDFDEPVVWSFAVGRLIHEFSKMNEDKRIVAHFHEWMAGSALLYLKSVHAKVATVFTTHATMIGRTLASQNVDIYSRINEIDANAESYKYGMHYKQHVESACAKTCEAFTTVSEITGIEAEHFLGRKPDVLVLNGLDMAKFPTFEESSVRHRRFRNKIRQFVMSYFFPYYTFELDKTLIFFICGRYEFSNKGIDILIRALNLLNDRLKGVDSNKTIVTFFFIPGNRRGIKKEILENKAFFTDLKDSISDNEQKIELNILSSLLSNEDLTTDKLFRTDMIDEVQLKLRRFIRGSGLPPLSTHDLYDEDSDAIINAFKTNNLNNTEGDRVKVMLYPIYLTGADGLLNTDYYETITGSHLGIFPSYYEPYGYTPLETSALGVASVTTDLAGFGRFIKTQIKSTKNPGIYVLEREGKSHEEQVEHLADIMFHYATIPIHDRIESKINAKSLADLADWNILIENYIRAHNLALEKLK